jgi:hypothetical protein
VTTTALGSSRGRFTWIEHVVAVISIGVTTVSAGASARIRPISAVACVFSMP